MNMEGVGGRIVERGDISARVRRQLATAALGPSGSLAIAALSALLAVAVRREVLDIRGLAGNQGLLLCDVAGRCGGVARVDGERRPLARANRREVHWGGCELRRGVGTGGWAWCSSPKAGPTPAAFSATETETSPPLSRDAAVEVRFLDFFASSWDPDMVVRG